MRNMRGRKPVYQKADTAGGQAAVDASFARQSTRVGQPRLGQRRADAIARNPGPNVDDVATVQISNCAAADREPIRKFSARQLGARRRRDISRVEEHAVGLTMLAFRLGRLDNEIDEAAWNSDVPRRDGPAGDEVLRLADDETPVVMCRLGDCEGVQGDGLFVEGTIAIRVDLARTKDADVNREAAIEHEVLVVNALNGDIVRRVLTSRLVDFAAFDPRINERPQPNSRQVSGTARRNGSI